MVMEKLQKDLLENSDKLVFGTERSLKLIKNDRLRLIYLARNCADSVRDEIKHYGKEIEIVELDASNNEIGVVCKKPFSVSVIGLTK